MAWTIATKEDVLSIYKIDITSLQDQWSVAAESLLLNYLGKENVADITTTSNFIEYISGTDGRVLITNYPIGTLNSISIDDTLRDATDYTIIGREIVANLSTANPGANTYFPKGYRNIVIDYQSSVPNKEIYKLAVMTMIAAISNYEGRKGADRDLEWGNLSQQFSGGDTVNQNIGLISHLNAILDQLIGRKEKVKIR